MNLDKNIKLILMKLNMQGHEVTLIREQRYSKEFKSIYARYKLTFWVEGIRKNKKTGETEACKVPDTHEFDKAIDLLKYMVVIANERTTKDIC